VSDAADAISAATGGGSASRALSQALRALASRLAEDSDGGCALIFAAAPGEVAAAQNRALADAQCC